MEIKEFNNAKVVFTDGKDRGENIGSQFSDIQQNKGYCVSGIRRVGDFLLGIFIVAAIGFLAWILDGLNFYRSFGKFGNDLQMIGLYLLPGIIILSIVILFNKGRKYIAIGIIIGLLIPIIVGLILLGSCIFSDSSF